MTSPFESPGSSPQMWKTSSPDIIWPECILGLAPPKTIVIEVNCSHKTVLFMWWWCLSHVTKMLSDYSLTLVFFLHLVSSSCWDYNTTSWLSYKNTSVNTAHINSSSTRFCCPLKFRGYLWILPILQITPLNTMFVSPYESRELLRIHMKHESVLLTSSFFNLLHLYK